MKDRIFLDTNVYVDFFDDSNQVKQNRAEQVIHDLSKEGITSISYQVIQEFCNLALGKFKNSISPEDTLYFVNSFMFPYCHVYPSYDLIEKATAIHAAHKYSFHDSLILAAAIQSNCKYLYSEDLQHGQKVEGVEIVDPFR